MLSSPLALPYAPLCQRTPLFRALQPLCLARPPWGWALSDQQLLQDSVPGMQNRKEQTRFQGAGQRSGLLPSVASPGGHVDLTGGVGAHFSWL